MWGTVYWEVNWLLSTQLGNMKEANYVILDSVVPASRQKF